MAIGQKYGDGESYTSSSLPRPCPIILGLVEYESAKEATLRNIMESYSGRMARALRDFEFVSVPFFGTGRTGLLSVLS